MREERPGSRAAVPSEHFIKPKPSLPSLLSSTRVITRNHLSGSHSKLADDNQSIRSGVSDIFTPYAESTQDYFGDSVTVDSFRDQSKGRGKDDEDPRDILLQQLKKNKLGRQLSSASIASRSGFLIIKQESKELRLRTVHCSLH